MSYINISSSANQELAQRLLTTNFAGTVLEGALETDEDYQTGVVVTGEDSFLVDHRTLEKSEDAESNGSSQVMRYNLDGCTVFIESGGNDGLHIYPQNTSIVDFVSEWDTGNLDLPEFLAEWGFDATPDEAPEGATDVRIWCQPNYYAGTLGAPFGHYVDATEVDTSNGCYNSGEHARFTTVDEAQSWIDSKEEGIYCTAHGEAGRPAYTICE